MVDGLGFRVDRSLGRLPVAPQKNAGEVRVSREEAKGSNEQRNPWLSI